MPAENRLMRAIFRTAISARRRLPVWALSSAISVRVPLHAAGRNKIGKCRGSYRP